MSQQAKYPPHNTDASVEDALGSDQRRLKQLRQLGLGIEMPESEDLRGVLDALKTLGHAFGVAMDTAQLLRERVAPAAGTVGVD